LDPTLDPSTIQTENAGSLAPGLRTLTLGRKPSFQRLYPVRRAFNVFNNLRNLLSLSG
jgi:hypothetical protein